MCKCWDQTASERPTASAALRKLGVVRAELLNQSKASLLLFDCVTTNDLTRLQVIIREAEERHFELRRRSVDIHASSSSVSLQQSDSASNLIEFIVLLLFDKSIIEYRFYFECRNCSIRVCFFFFEKN